MNSRHHAKAMAKPRLSPQLINGAACSGCSDPAGDLRKPTGSLVGSGNHMKNYRGLLLLAILAGGCSLEKAPTEPPTPSTVGAHPAAQPVLPVALGAQRYLPVGTIVPVGVPITAPPEPFDSRRHTYASSSLDAINLVGKPGEVLPPRFRSRKTPSGSVGFVQGTPAPGSADFAIKMQQYTQQWYGVYQVNDVGLDLVLPQRTAQDTGYVYAPTLLPPGHTCIEVTTVHRRGPGASAPTKHYQGWFDWCYLGPTGVEGRWAVFVPIDAQSGFLDRYVREYLGKPTLTVSIVTPTTFNGCWYGHMYDYLVGGWVQTLASCTRPTSYSPGDFGGAHGWTAWESWYVAGNPVCPLLLDIRALNIQFANPNTSQFQPITDTPNDVSATGSVSNCWTNLGYGPYTFVFPGGGAGLPANSWKAITSVPRPPLNVTISGQSTVRPSVSCVWTASIGNGSAPFVYTWSVNGQPVSNNSPYPFELVYQNTGATFTIGVSVTDVTTAVGSATKSAAISGSAPVCLY